LVVLIVLVGIAITIGITIDLSTPIHLPCSSPQPINLSFHRFYLSQQLSILPFHLSLFHFIPFSPIDECLFSIFFSHQIGLESFYFLHEFCGFFLVTVVIIVSAIVIVIDIDIVIMIIIDSSPDTATPLQYQILDLPPDLVKLHILIP